MKRWLFDRILKSTLIYNQCWEDPSVDRAALSIREDDRIVTITSAGCNALDYLLKGPQRIDCVDLNPRQTALLDLKLAAISRLSYSEFFEMFGSGRIKGHGAVYGRLRSGLSAQSREIWDNAIDYFDPRGPGLYFHGAAGRVAGALLWRARRSLGFAEDLQRFQMFQSLEEQAAFYRANIAPVLWSQPIPWLLNRSVTMALLGVPSEQMRQVRAASGDLLSDHIRARVDHVFTAIPIQDNYFWRVYMNGRYTPDCCPNYLRKENFDLLRRSLPRIKTHTSSLAEFLERRKDRFSVYVLLDHMDWLTDAPDLLRLEWEQILRTADPGARIIYRSGGATFDHIPAFAAERIRMDSARARSLHAFDRVGTYGSFHLATVAA